jgi:prepilin-type N-terminal cleavage/methylation domain-containing protein
MVCKTTFTSKSRGLQAGFTLVEFLIATGLGAMLLTVVAFLMVYACRSFISMANYLDLDQHSQQSMDKMSREIRTADHLTAFATNDLSFLDQNGNTVRYLYDANAQALERISGGVTNNYLTGCNWASFTIYQRNPISNTFEPYSTSTYTNAKMIEITWNCSRTILSAKANTESIQSAKVELRNH